MRDNKLFKFLKYFSLLSRSLASSVFFPPPEYRLYYLKLPSLGYLLRI